MPLSPEQAEILMLYALHRGRTSINVAMVNTRRELDRRGLPPPSYGAMRYFLLKWRKENLVQWTYWRKGKQAAIALRKKISVQNQANG